MNEGFRRQLFLALLIALAETVSIFRLLVKEISSTGILCLAKLRMKRNRTLEDRVQLLVKL